MSEEIRPMTPTEEEAELARVTAALVTLAQTGIDPDVIELLVQGDPMRGIAPGAMAKAVQAIRDNALEEAAKDLELVAEVLSSHDKPRHLREAAARIRALKAKTQGE